MLYRVRAFTADQTLREFDLEAIDRVELDAKIAAQMLVAISVRVLSRDGVFTRFGAGSFSTTLFSQELLALLKAGLSIVEAIESLLEKESSMRSRAILESILSSLRDGEPLSRALRRIPNVFTPLYLGIIQAAEGTSDLPLSLSRYLEYRKRLDLLKAQIIGASIYPCILIIAGTAVSLFLMGYVVPRFATVYESSGHSLPFASNLLLVTGRFIGAHQLQIVVGLGALVGAIVTFGGRALRSGRLFDWTSHIAGIGTRIRLVELSRLYMTLGMLLEGGLPIKTALLMCASALSPTTGEKVRSSIGMISEGTSLSDSFEQCGLTTPIAARLMRVGEKSGQIGAMLTQSAQFYEEDTSRWMSRFTKIFEPALMAFIGLLVGGIVVLLYMPIFDLAGSIQ